MAYFEMWCVFKILEKSVKIGLSTSVRKKNFIVRNVTRIPISMHFYWKEWQKIVFKRNILRVLTIKSILYSFVWNHLIFTKNHFSKLRMQPLKCIEEQNEPLQFLYFNSSPAMFLIVLTRSILVNKVFSVIILRFKTKLLNHTVGS